ncbi:hypothetical protein BDZ94DRAFT_335007 [Collybia nuda]|uniref:DNA2/NAM7 helicase helicase domain-containing protein n=1 Tax=Collybia nuda TaxID=64659 RepID=A0A9P5XRZ4_9AGAR|nr:hypothetical protein BDZ94DRAFT_335007 [Collybia nuda]
MAPSLRATNLMQTLIDGPYSLVKIPTITFKESDISIDTLSVFDHVRPIGISPGYSKSGILIALAIADDQNCRIVEFNRDTAPRRLEGGGQGRGGSRQPIRHDTEGLRLLQDVVLCRQAGDLFAFDMGPLSMSLYCDTKLRVTNAVDIQSGISAVDRKPITAIVEVVGSSVPVMKENIKTVFRNPVYDQEDRNRATDLAMRAWVSQFLAGYENGAETFAKVPKVDTKKFSPQVLDIIAKIANDAHRLDQMKPTQTIHRVSVMTDNTTGENYVRSNTFKDRVRWDKEVRLSVDGSAGNYIVPGQIGGVTGKDAALSTIRSLSGKSIGSTLISIGRDDPTTAEAQRAATVLRILQGNTQLLDNSPWIKNIWFPDDDLNLFWPEEWSLPASPPYNSQSSNDSVKSPPSSPMVLQPLNPSQQEAVNTMYSPEDAHRITIIQGPPGTGKTSVIAAYVQLAIEDGSNGIWLVAQSNVAVKNIAEKLMKVGFLDWKLLVSRDFHFQWYVYILWDLFL